MKLFIFNWSELRRHGQSNFDAILCLTYATTMGYNTKIANDIVDLAHILNIKEVPVFLFSKRYLHQFRFVGKSFITNKYRTTKDPQSYFTNREFLFSDLTAKEKVEYLYLLSRRKLTDNNSYIAESVVESKFLNHALVEHKGYKIYFLTEKEMTNNDKIMGRYTKGEWKYWAETRNSKI